MTYKFDHDWFSPNISNLTFLFSGFPKNRELRILEIGAFEGRSTCWFLDHIPSCSITTIDTFMGGVDHDPNNPDINFRTVKENFYHNISQHEKDRVTVIEKKSFDALMELNQDSRKFDFVFVDGSHTAIDVNSDLVLSFPLLVDNALIYCDDYLWGFGRSNLGNLPNLDFTYDSPKLGIDSFVNVYRNKLAPVQGCLNNAAVYIKVAN
jgi:predicted O-methyltransferase YrrM